MKINGLYLTGLTALLFFLVWQMPASQLYRLCGIHNKLPEIGIIGLEGSWHNGRCRWLWVDDIQINGLRWHLEPLSILTEGAVSFVFNTPDTGSPVQAQGVLSIKPDGRYTIMGSCAARDPRLRFGLSLLGNPAADGKIDISFTGTLLAE